MVPEFRWLPDAPAMVGYHPAGPWILKVEQLRSPVDTFVQEFLDSFQVPYNHLN